MKFKSISDRDNYISTLDKIINATTFSYQDFCTAFFNYFNYFQGLDNPIIRNKLGITWETFTSYDNYGRPGNSLQPATDKQLLRVIKAIRDLPIIIR